MKNNRQRLILILVLAWSACQPGINTENSSAWVDEKIYDSTVLAYQTEQNHLFLSGENEVLDSAALATQRALSFFEPNQLFRFRARFKEIKNGEVFKMITSKGGEPLYRKYGILEFDYAESKQHLYVYQNVEHPEHFFCPFRDANSTKTTYGAGRYLDFNLKDLENPILDFNYAYNPLCAYSKRYSCPIAPSENTLEIAINAGVKLYNDVLH